MSHQIYEKTLKELDQMTDGLGLGIDSEIKETVAILNCLGFPTTGSCAGHSDRALAAPWIDIEVSEYPDEKYIDEKLTIQKYADKHSISFDEVDYFKNPTIYIEASTEYEANGEHPELTKFKEDNRKLRERLEGYVAEFSQNRTIENDDRFEFETYGIGETFRLHNGGSDYETLVEDMIPEQREGVAERLGRHQKEMREFTEFLKEKYFNGAIV